MPYRSGSPPPLDAAPIPTGVAGLDSVLAGGYPSNRAHLIEGRPGTGKTTLGLQFLMDGVRRGETSLYFTLSETRRELLSVAAQHGWSLEGIHIYELVPPELSLDPKQYQSLVYSSDLELGETVALALAEIERVKPKRVVFDSLSEIRLLSQGSLRYRRQVLALKGYFLQNDATVLMLDDLSGADDDHLHSIVHGVIRLEHNAPPYGAEQRRFNVIKMRGTAFRGGYHDYTITKGGVTIYPRLSAIDRHTSFRFERIASGLTEIDAMLGGGLDRGTSTLFVGPSGAGKSTLALSYVRAALARGEPALIVSFDETTEILLERARGVGLGLNSFVESGLLTIRKVDPANISTGEFADGIKAATEAGTRMVVIDSITGYMAAMTERPALLLQMHELVTFLNQQGVLTIMILAQHGMIGPMQSPIDLTYVSDAVVVLRFFEAHGRVRRALSVLKKRTGAHEDTIREFRIDAQGLRVGPPLDGFHGVLTGVPTYVGEGFALLEGREPADAAARS